MGFNSGFKGLKRAEGVGVLFCALSGLCDELITRLGESYRVRVCLIVCDPESSTRSWPRADLVCGTTAKKYYSVNEVLP